MQIRTLISSKMVYVIGTHKLISFNCSKSKMVGSFRLTDEYTCQWQEGSDIWKSNKFFSDTSAALAQWHEQKIEGFRRKCTLSLLAAELSLRQQFQGDLGLCAGAGAFGLKEMNSLKGENQYYFQSSIYIFLPIMVFTQQYIFLLMAVSDIAPPLDFMTQCPYKFY